ncbi:PP2C family protein-serine/threonine phosphatase [Polymorphobacter multimanifer]|uniref:Serine/threonine protein phosphatase PrpC n=1 Tax=Polymorphobacter multimanifer TaxID=1070431 RepID=A0A841L3P3_9SPHN|nr:protein phosphatase 2C domain-containing protein [Polymorphobacter multimanifer]MBB6227459.1 serine/threonine protein phosphatase PrpC [Polymorphobacter multimanifer]
MNEDSAVGREDVALWMVADGMGGHAHGDWASQTLAAQFGALVLPAADGNHSAILSALHAGNAAIIDAASQAGSDMGTTAVLLHLQGADLLCVWVGDSRAYRFRQGRLVQISRDHSVVQEMVDRGMIEASEAESHPMAHVLSRAVGTEAELRAEVVQDQAQPGDLYLLCTDGLTKVVADADIIPLLRQPNVTLVAERLVAETLARGAPDNVTVIVISVEEVTELMRMDA